MNTNQTSISKDFANKKLIVEREFNAPLKQVWKAWTEKDLLDQWWAPKPWKAVTISMNFSNGGTWLYYMLGPDGSKQYCRADYNNIVTNKSYSAIDSFCDENGNDVSGLPGMQWENEFTETASGTKVRVEITFASEEDMETIIKMGFKEGFTAAHSNLDEVLEGQMAA